MKKKTMLWRPLWLLMTLLWLGGPGWRMEAAAQESGFMRSADAMRAAVGNENAVCDTLRMKWKAKAGEEKAFSFAGTRGGRYVLHWGDGDTTPLVATGELDRVAHVYARGGSYNVSLCGLPRGGEPSGEDYVETALGMELPMVYVQGGTFEMGCTAEQGGDCFEDERPVHTVTLDGFYIGAYEVTQVQWEAVMGTKASSFSKGDDYPVDNINWEEAQEFCAKLSELTGKKYRLPTEAEWEYAARGGQNPDGTKYAGSNTLGAVAWHHGNSGGLGSEHPDYGTHPVGQKRPNGLGLYDMSGNVYEWCSDWYGDYSSSSADNPQGPATGSYRVSRGGCWRDVPAQSCRVSYRGFYSVPAYAYDYQGFRVVCEGTRPDPEDAVAALEASMVYVQGGTFEMGCTAEQGGDCEGDEKPVHSVTLSDFYIGAYEVTQAQWAAVMGTNPCSSSYGLGDDYPVYNVSWTEAVEFCNKLSQKTGKKYRLPTEAEWEYAARGGQKAAGTKYAGSNTIGDVAWYSGNSGSKAHPVGQKRSNGLGLYDMSGNVLEWCSDWYGSYGSSSATDPQGPSSGSSRVSRGGSWDGSAQYCRVSIRINTSPGDRYCDLGFRVVCEGTRPDPEDAVAALEASMVYVRGGTFEMGCTADQGGDDDEQPVHTVTLDGFYIGQYEVTQAQWAAVMGTTVERQRDKASEQYGEGMSLYGVGDDYPMYYVNWDEAKEFCAKLSELTGKKYRLPTEAEWEYAARGGQKADGTKYAGSKTIGDVAWYDGNSGSKAHPVGQKRPNGLGLCDMSGNVWEWCSDWYGSYGSSSATNPQGPSSGSYRVARGGSWVNYAQSCRVSSRGSDTPGSRNYDLGFRVVCER